MAFVALLPKMSPARTAVLVAGAAIASSSSSRSVSAAVAAAAADGGAQNLPSNHPDVILDKFGGHLKCPYAHKWMAVGPEAAAEELGMIPPAGSGRKLKDLSLEGSCSYDSQWTGPSCIEFRGEGWKADNEGAGAAAMEARCSASGTEGTAVPGQECAKADDFAGYCVVVVDAEDDSTKAEYNVLTLGAGMGCADVENACVTFVRGEFVPDGKCSVAKQEGEEEDGHDAMWGSDSSSSTPSRCAIAPGPIGGAHQDGYSKGYDFTCPGTPAESSPYQWPLRWAANFEGGSILYGTDNVIYQNGGRVFYRLDKNWKRHDFYYQRGYQRSITQGPCKQQIDEDGEMRCIRDSDSQSVVLHRGNKMVFIELNNSTVLRSDGKVDVADIDKCSYMDLKIIGNIRPDWFMDKRGASVDVQYLGNQHIYYPSGSLDSGAPTRPRLAKQWRKKDFANHYFTMSMQEHLGPEGVHWPLVLNVPGEGFGDDSIQHYYNHTLLTEDDEGIFLLDEAFEAARGSCPQISRSGGGGDGEGGGGGGGGGGPPSLKEPFPSDLEVDENAWYSNVYTFSPVWRPPMEKEEGGTSSKCAEQGGNYDSGMATKTVGPNTVVKSCFHSSTGEVELAVTFGDVDAESPLPWLALAFRKDEECAMTPRGGGDGEVILITSGSDGGENDPVATYGPLSPAVRRFEGFDELMALPPLEEADGFAHASVERGDDGAVTLHFRRSAGALIGESNGQPILAKMVEQGDAAAAEEGSGMNGVLPPTAMHLTYAYGMAPTLGYHAKKGCFEVIDFPACPAEENTSSEVGASKGDSSSQQPKEAKAEEEGGQNDAAVKAAGTGTRASDARGKSSAVLFAILAASATFAAACFV